MGLIKADIKTKLDKLEGNHCQENAQALFEAQKNLWDHMELYTVDLHQKSKCNWIKWNDDSITYFYAKMTTRKHRNKEFGN